jgi:hypothetical protein
VGLQVADVEQDYQVKVLWKCGAQRSERKKRAILRVLPFIAEHARKFFQSDKVQVRSACCALAGTHDAACPALSTCMYVRLHPVSNCVFSNERCRVHLGWAVTATCLKVQLWCSYGARLAASSTAALILPTRWQGAPFQVRQVVCLGNCGLVCYDMNNIEESKACSWLQERLAEDQWRAGKAGTAWNPCQACHRRGRHSGSYSHFKVDLWYNTMEQHCFAEACRSRCGARWKQHRWLLPEHFAALREAFDNPHPVDAELEHMFADQFGGRGGDAGAGMSG